jgi:uncharacterized NAD(P)/FAD-binding protein YdhS
VSTVADSTRECSSSKPTMFFTTSRSGAAHHGHAVVGLLAEGGAVLVAALSSLERELVVGQLELLQAQHVDRVGRQPVQHVLQRAVSELTFQVVIFMVVEIPYSTNTYSIKYRSSVDLMENNGKIHKNYNGWIQNLTRGINAQLTAV